jgi:metal-responsive CopG/Arc/MetJ family transcriptional regulator
MRKEKIAITLDEEYLAELDRLIREQIFVNRSQAIQTAVGEKLAHLKHDRLAVECAKLDRTEEKTLAEEGLAEDVKSWPEY